MAGCQQTDNKRAVATTGGDSAMFNVQKSLLFQDSLLQKDSSNPEAWYEKALLHAELRDTSLAIEALENSFHLQPLVSTGVALAELYAETKNSKVLELCDVLLKADSLNELIDPIFIQGIYYSRIGNTKEALAAYERCILRDWKFIEAYMEKGIILFNQQKIPESLKTFQLAATVSVSYADAYYWIGKCYEATGQKKEALENYSKAFALDSEFTEAEEAIKRINIL